MGRDGDRRARGHAGAEPVGSQRWPLSWPVLAFAWGCASSTPEAAPPPPAAPAALPASSPAPEPWGAPPSADPGGALALTRLAALPAGPVAFDPTRGRLVLAAGDQLRVLDGSGALLEKWSVGTGVQDLAFAPDGTLWVLLSGAVARVRDGVVQCRAEDLQADLLLGVDASGALNLTAITWLETGAWGELLSVDSACAVTRGELTRPAPSARVVEGGQVWTGTTAKVGPGPSREGPPTVIHDGQSWAVFADDPETNQVDELVVGQDAVLAQADNGRWELWSKSGKRIAGAKAAAGAERVPGTAAAAVGMDLVSLVDGKTTADALPAVVVAISPDGALWVLGEEGERALWRRQSP